MPMHFNEINLSLFCYNCSFGSSNEHTSLSHHSQNVSVICSRMMSTDYEKATTGTFCTRTEICPILEFTCQRIALPAIICSHECRSTQYMPRSLYQSNNNSQNTVHSTQPYHNVVCTARLVKHNLKVYNKRSGRLVTQFCPKLW